MKILIVSSFLPYPLFSGGHIRLYNLIRELSAKHAITVVCEKRAYQSGKDVEEVKKICEEVITVERKDQWTPSNIFSASFSKNSFLVVGHTQQEMKEKIVAALNSKRFDLIHVETFYVFQNVPKTYLPVVVCDHNIEYLVYKRYVDQAPVYLRPLLYIDIAKMKLNEEHVWRKAKKVIAVSEKEKVLMHLPHTEVIANGVDVKAFPFRNPEKIFAKKEKKILFIGDFKWIQNRVAANWILDEIWPKILSSLSPEEAKGIKLWIVGKNMTDKIREKRNKNIIVDEDAPSETWRIFHQAYALLAPITVGGGTSYKILEAMASGVGVITTSLGIEGIEVERGKEVLIADASDDLAARTVEILQNTQIYETIVRRARICIEDNYTWFVIAKKLDLLYKNVIANNYG